jgi:hypothetical protein
LTELSESAVPPPEIDAARPAVRLTDTCSTPYCVWPSGPSTGALVIESPDSSRPSCSRNSNELACTSYGAYSEPSSTLNCDVPPSMVTGWSPMVMLKVVTRSSWRRVHANW